MQDNSLTTNSINEIDERYRIFAELSPDAVVVTIGGNVVYANNAAAVLWGASLPSELVGNSAMALTCADYHGLTLKRQPETTTDKIDGQRSASERKLSARNNPRILPRIDCIIQMLNGQEKRVETSGIELPSNGQKRAIFVMRNISEHKEMADALKKSEATVQALLRAAPDILFRISREGKILDATPPTKMIWSRPPESMLENHCMSCCPKR